MAFDTTAANEWRLRTGRMASTDEDSTFGAFFIPLPGAGERMKIIACQAHGWEHVSVSMPMRCPTWDEMCIVRDLFWGPDDCVMQLHPPQTLYVNNHPYCLHLWRPMDGSIPIPPRIMV